MGGIIINTARFLTSSFYRTYIYTHAPTHIPTRTHTRPHIFTRTHAHTHDSMVFPAPGSRISAMSFTLTDDYGFALMGGKNNKNGTISEVFVCANMCSELVRV